MTTALHEARLAAVIRAVEETGARTSSIWAAAPAT